MHRLQEYYRARETLSEYMAKQIADRKDEIHGEVEGAAKRQDVFSLLVRANEDNGKLKLDDSELACLITCTLRRLSLTGCLLHRLAMFLGSCSLAMRVLRTHLQPRSVSSVSIPTSKKSYTMRSCPSSVTASP